MRSYHAEDTCYLLALRAERQRYCLIKDVYAIKVKEDSKMTNKTDVNEQTMKQNENNVASI